MGCLKTGETAPLWAVTAGKRRSIVAVKQGIAITMGGEGGRWRVPEKKPGEANTCSFIKKGKKIKQQDVGIVN